ncbi:adenylosuccinate synthetase [Companilactobacillus sp. RD055328]|uniref:adenylosuccinate synthase n=1 Tax=Companilactobacillus sp. RD055328 TaxID=2916634 RepID=UPI001FC822AD|nr:adenylosuccinate synthase [Companilactobacillus sp. RD055328]GKQ43397.1 adenylosuccinate synthetase [Companilactobacillus sp. RD055328]
MSSIVIVGSQWGDEGKGKITDFLGEQANIIARYQGGDNAGHTLEVEGKVYKLRLIPSGILYQDKTTVIGNGVVINPESLVVELKKLKEQGIDTSNLKISNRAHVIFPYHIKEDELQEAAKGDDKIGTTNRGIGPAYMDKASRTGIRVAELINPTIFKEKLRIALDRKNKEFIDLYQSQPLDFDEIYTKYSEYAALIKDMVVDTSVVLNEAIDNKENVLFEGAQGIMLDIDQGTYPYVTSSNPAAGVSIGAGVGPNKIDRVVGVVKAYTSRVGDGPFPTQLDDATGDYIRTRGHEYGTVTKRPRRVGWLDTVVLRHAFRVSGVTDIALNVLDVLTGIDSIKICTAYELDGKEINYYPATVDELIKCKPVYTEVPGWTEDITNVKNYEDLPINAKKYLETLEKLTNARIATVSVGPNRSQTLLKANVWDN